MQRALIRKPLLLQDQVQIFNLFVTTQIQIQNTSSHLDHKILLAQAHIVQLQYSLQPQHQSTLRNRPQHLIQLQDQPTVPKPQHLSAQRIGTTFIRTPTSGHAAVAVSQRSVLSVMVAVGIEDVTLAMATAWCHISSRVISQDPCSLQGLRYTSMQEL